MATLLEEACDWAASLRLEDIPADVRELAVAQLMSAAGARQATLRHPVGATLAASLGGEGWAVAGARDALLTMALDYDETAFAGHIGHACALPVLRCAAEVGASGRRLMEAMVAASEVAARLTASVTLGPARGQTAAHTHAAGATVGAAVILGLDARSMTAALSLALAQPRRVLLPAFMGSEAKFWVAATPVLDAARALDVAATGGRGLPAVLEGRGGVFETMADVPLPEAFSGYGQRWHLRTLSIKAVPGCAYLTSLVEAAASLGPLDLEEVASVEAAVSILTLGMEAESAPFVDGPATPLPALGFTCGYNVAAALEGGALGLDDLQGARLERPGRWRVARGLRLSHDEELTVRALSATAPLGAGLAWAGERALPYLEAHGARADLARRVIELAGDGGGPGFESPAKRIGARVTVTLRDGATLEAQRDAAAGSCQESPAERVAVARAKLDRPPLAGRLARLAELSPGELRQVVEAELRG